MEFPFDINKILPLEITILNGDYRILNHGYAARISATDRLTSVIETIGEASYKAQGLPGPVTTAKKFRISDHRLYIVKDSSDNKTLGSVVGFLKVGAKHLYVYDSHGQVHERTPLCLLDFYVHESKQRSGYGKKLFNVMLEFEKCNAHELAIDRPSNKCLGFLHKHYNLSSPIRQVNNFVVYNAFFNVKPDMTQNRRLSASKQRQELTSWMLPSERPKPRPYSEQNDGYRQSRLRTLTDENELFRNPRQTTTIDIADRKPYSAVPTINYNNQFNRQTRFNRDDSLPPPAPHVPRSYTNLFNENNPFPSLQRYNTNPVLSTNKQTYTYKDYQAESAINPNQKIDKFAQPEPLTSLYTFPSLMKPNNNWRKPYSQPSTIEGSSSAWRLFGVHHA